MITSTYTLKLDMEICKTDITAWIIDRSSFKIFEIVITNFQVSDMPERFQFFKKTYLSINTCLEKILKMSLLFFNNINIVFMIMTDLKNL